MTNMVMYGISPLRKMISPHDKIMDCDLVIIMTFDVNCFIKLMNERGTMCIILIVHSLIFL
jgi:hypothetical protein